MFSSSKAYKLLVDHQQASPLFKWMWAVGNLGKHKFFFWLLLMDRLNTRNMLKRKNRHLNDYNCVLCNSNSEGTCFHLFFSCPFSTACWNSVNITWNINLQPLDMICQARIDFNSCIFREIVITACWVIWTTRNGVIFDAKSHNLNHWKHDFKEELGLVCIKAKKKTAVALNSWCENIP